MKVYSVIDEDGLIGVFSSEDLAKSYINKYENCYGESAYIQDDEIDKLTNQNVETFYEIEIDVLSEKINRRSLVKELVFPDQQRIYKRWRQSYKIVTSSRISEEDAEEYARQLRSNYLSNVDPIKFRNEVYFKQHLLDDQAKKVFDEGDRLLKKRSVEDPSGIS